MTEDLTWWDDAACREIGGDSFYPEQGESNAEAKRICFRCPVRAECLEEALGHHKTYGGWGLWGGVTEDERRRMVRDRKKAAA